MLGQLYGMQHVRSGDPTCRTFQEDGTRPAEWAEHPEVLAAICDGFCSTVPRKRRWCPGYVSTSGKGAGAKSTSGLGAGPVAGIGVGAFVVGGGVAGLLVFFLVKKSSWNTFA